MANKNKAKGTKAETAVCKYLKDNGIEAKRKALTGSQDEGDVDVVLSNGRHITLEVKAGKQTANYNRSLLMEWLRQAEVEGSNSNTDCYLVIVRYNRKLIDAEVWMPSTRRMIYLDEFIENNKEL